VGPVTATAETLPVSGQLDLVRQAARGDALAFERLMAARADAAFRIAREVILHEDGGPPTVAPITGGTGEFLGATGTVTCKKVTQGGGLVIAISN
jgi:hypothetical protein